MPRSVLRIGTRGSALALAHAEVVRRAISDVITHRNFELVLIATDGDSFVGPLPDVGGKAMFVREIQDALASGKIDLAVHPAETLPARRPEQIMLAAITKREDPREALLTRSGGGLNSLQTGTTVGTTSARVAAQLRAMQRGLVPTPIRGNLDARLRMMSDGAVQALVVAVSGLKRLGRADRVAEMLPITTMLPAPGQGSLAIECRSSDKNMKAALAQLDDPRSRRAFEAERSFMLAFGENDNLPLAALAEADEERIRVRGLIASLDGKRVLNDQVEGEDAEKAGIELAERLRAMGADEILAANV